MTEEWSRAPWEEVAGYVAWLDMEYHNMDILMQHFNDLKYHREIFTCCGCSIERTCPWAYDMYNTNGDCLGLK